MRVDILTLFPGIFSGPLDHSILARAREAGLLAVEVHDLRDYAEGKHRVTDDPPFGGGGGMVMKPEPIFSGVEAIRKRFGPGKAVLLSPQGELLTHRLARRLAGEEHLILICGRYEGVDQRVADHLADFEISIGDYVLTGGELPALVLVDAVARFVPGVIGDPLAPTGIPSKRGSSRGRNTPAPGSSAGLRSPTCSCRATTPRSRSGAGTRGCAGPWQSAPISGRKS